MRRNPNYDVLKGMAVITVAGLVLYNVQSLCALLLLFPAAVPTALVAVAFFALLGEAARNGEATRKRRAEEKQARDELREELRALKQAREEETKRAQADLPYGRKEEGA